MSKIKALFAILSLAVVAISASAQQKTYTAADYSRAEKFMGYNTNPLVYHNARPAWLPDDRVWFRDVCVDRTQFVLLDPATVKKEPAFDHAKLAAALNTAASPKTPSTANKLPF